MQSRILLVLFLLSLTLLLGINTEAMMITRDFRFAIDEIYLYGSQADNRWSKGDIFNISITYEHDEKPISYTIYEKGTTRFKEFDHETYSILSDATVASNLSRSDFGFLKFPDTYDYFYSWYSETTDGEQRFAYRKRNQETATYISDYLFFNGEDRFQYWSGEFQFRDSSKWTRVLFSTTPVPEPSTILLLGFGLISLAWFRRRR